MDITFSVFNNHVNKADKRARKLMRKHYPDWADEIDKATDKGIMSIFDKAPTPATAAYSMLVTAFVNENKKKKKKKKAGAK